MLSEIDIDTSPSFEALSYVWGSPDPAGEVTILRKSSNGAKETSRLPVTPNCLSALQALRCCFRARKLWIDAICIDQDSAEEKISASAMDDRDILERQKGSGVAESWGRRKGSSPADRKVVSPCRLAVSNALAEIV